MLALSAFKLLKIHRFLDLLLLGIDIGGTKVALALGDERGRLVARRRRPTEPSGRPQTDVERMVDDARRLMADADVSPSQLSAAGISVPGPLDPERGVVLGPPNLPSWSNVPVRELFASALDVPVWVENDANAAALAEWRFGAGRGLSHLVYLTMSTGIGAGLILDGRLYRGRHGNAGELGHVPVEWGGAQCACGMRGCFEAYAGGAAWTRRLREVAPETSRVVALAGGRERVDPEHVVAAAREGDDFARAELDRFNEYLARGIAVVAFLLAPQAVILGTIAAAAGEELCLARVRERVAARVWPALTRELRIVPAGLGEQLGAYAGLCTALEGLEAARS